MGKRRSKQGIHASRSAEPSRAAGASAIPGPAAIAVGFTALATFAPKLPFTTPYSPRLAALLLSAVVWCWAWSRGSLERRSETRRLDLALLAVVGVALLAALLAPTPFTLLTYGAEGGLLGLPAWLAMAGVFVLASRVVTEEEIRAALRLALIWGVAVAAAVIYQMASGRMVSAGFGNSNFVGAMLLLVAPLALEGATSTTERGWKRAYVGSALLIWVAAAVAGSTAVQIALAVQVLAVVALAPRLLGDVVVRWRTLIAMLLAGLLLFGALTSVLSVTTEVLPEGLDAPLEEALTGATVITRIEMWKVAVGVWRDSPVFGAGPDGFQLASQRRLTKRLLEVESGATSGHRALVRDPHSFPLLALGSLGALGLALLLWLFAEWLLALRLRWRERRRDDHLPFALAIGAGTFLLCTLLMPWHIVFAAMPALVAGLALARAPVGKKGRSDRAEPGPEDGAMPHPIPRALLVVATALVAVTLSAGAIASDAFATRALNTRSASAASAAWAEASRAQPWRPYTRFEWLYSLGRLTGEGSMTADDYRSKVALAPVEISRDGGYLALLAQPSLDEAMMTGREDLSWERETISRAASLAPNHPDTVLERAHLALAQRDTATAEQWLKIADGYAAETDRYLLYRYQAAVFSEDASAATVWGERVRNEAPWLTMLMVLPEGGR